MRVGINITPLTSAHKARGIGYYTKNLIEYLRKDDSIKVLEFKHLSELKDVDVIHYPWFDFYFHTLPIIKRIKTIVTIHDAIPLIFNLNYPVGVKGKINFFLQKLALKNVKAIITDSQRSRRDIMEYLDVRIGKIHTIPLAADEDFLQKVTDARVIQIKSKYKLPDKFILYVGDANWVKNLPFLIKGFAALIQKEALKDFKLVLVGGVFLKNVDNIDHPELKSLKTVNKLIKELGLSHQVIKPGNIIRDELIAFYHLATAYVQPSIYEGFGLPILEAFSAGTPVISSNCGSLPEVAGEAAVYFDPHNLNQFVKIAEDVLLNKSLQKKLSDLGIKQALNFSWEKTMELTKAVYTEVINNE